jgi:outer membrane protein TolC
MFPVHASPARIRRALLSVALALGSAVAPVRALARPPAVDLATTSDRLAVVEEAISRNPGLKAATERIRSVRAMSEADGRLPDPELMFQIWQVPFEHPVSFRDSQMIMAGLVQTIPAPGSLSARSEARAHTASAEEAVLADRARELVRDVEHAYADMAEAVARHRAHVAHRGVADRMLSAARARQASGGSLDEVAQADLMLARLDADIAMEAASVARTKARLNGFLSRPYDAPLADPEPSAPATVTLTPDALVQLALRVRPDLHAANARIDAERSALTSAERESSLPSFTLGASYFAPTTNMPFHGYGVSASMTLPWVWGGNARKEDAERALAQASHYDRADAELRIGVDVGTASATARAASEQLRALQSGALPAAKRALDVTLATYGAGRGDLPGVVRAEQAVVDTEIDVVVARASLDHALADLDWAVGTLLPRTPLDLQPGPGR